MWKKIFFIIGISFEQDKNLKDAGINIYIKEC